MGLEKYSEREITEIEGAYNALIQPIGETMTLDEVGYVRQAYELCCRKYDGCRMKSGRPMMLHLLELAQITYSEMGMRSKSVVCALLHNITKYTDTTFDEIKEQFGERVMLIIKGLSKVMSLDNTNISMQSDTLRKLFLSMIDDIRVVLIVIAHTLYDCRHQDEIDDYDEINSVDSSDVKNDKKVRKFFENTKYLIIPIVHRLGLYKIKKELEEAVMIYENPDDFYKIRDKIKISHVVQEEKMAAFLQPIRKNLSEAGFDFTIKWRTKSIPSIFEKMKAQGVPFESVYDLFAVRIIINNSKKSEERSDCWKVYSIVTDLYVPNPKRLRDWITTPKASGYESLHTTVKNGEDWIEVQIRTRRMDEIAERGTASHWSYKNGNDKHQTADEWLNQIRYILEDSNQMNLNMLDDARARKAKSDKIFIITPQGDVKQLPVGSTVLDFAFEVHTQVGSHCIGAKVNGKMQPIRYELNNGDRVEIQTSKKQSPKIDWLGYVVAEKSKAKIRRYLKDMEMKEAELGSSIFHRKLKNWKISFNDKIFNDILKEYNCNSGIEFYHKIAINQIDLASLKAFILSVSEEKDMRFDRVEELKKDKPVDKDKDMMTISSDINGLAFKMAKCCSPILGDKVCGFINVTGGITIHRTDCKNAIALTKRYPYRLIDVKWQGDLSSRASIRVVANDSFGILSDITDVMKQMTVNIIDASMSVKNNLYEGRFVVQIPNANYLERMMHNIRSLRGVIEVQRVD